MKNNISERLFSGYLKAKTEKSSLSFYLVLFCFFFGGGFQKRHTSDELELLSLSDCFFNVAQTSLPKKSNFNIWETLQTFSKTQDIRGIH